MANNWYNNHNYPILIGGAAQFDSRKKSLKRCASRYPEYENFPVRLKSLDLVQFKWNPVQIRFLALEGFFYPGPCEFKPKCFCCGMVAYAVGNPYLPYQIHARNGDPPDGDCGYLEHVMNRDTCFDKGGGEARWQPCMDCKLCSWEFEMI
ncbi:hypothetical protein RP20_CCG007471 [Aedes albopictus]|nr:hypothetical protein RP20_CCG007471 [Aedes albopictus]